jgi:hypothetical protein
LANGGSTQSAQRVTLKSEQQNVPRLTHPHQR